MIRLPDGNLGKVMAAGICVLFVAAVYTAAIGPLMSLYGRSEQKLETRLALLQKLRSTAADLPRLRAAAKQWEDKTRKRDLLFSGSSDTVAGAALQSTLKDLIEDGGATLSSAELLAPQTVDNFRRVAVRVSFSGDLDLITNVLEGIETASPAIFVDNLDIRTAGDSNADDGNETFSIALDVHGFRTL